MAADWLRTMNTGSIRIEANATWLAEGAEGYEQVLALFRLAGRRLA